ncbi:MAG: VWA domain-containing protein [Rubrivivax sp.]|nr:VWA domain-containing protein [Rubrivivax sp.]
MTLGDRQGPCAGALDAPYDRLEALPRGTWLPGVITAAGTAAERLRDAGLWLRALDQAQLPAASADFGVPDASGPLREVVATLQLPALCRQAPALAEQLLRTLLWHLDRLIDLQPRQSRSQAIDTVTREFREAWQIQTQGLDQDLSLLLGLGDFRDLSWDNLQGQLRSRGWSEAQQAADRLALLPALAELIRRLGRAERSTTALPARTHRPQADRPRRSPLRLVQTRLPDAPGEITGVRWSAQPERMLSSEAVMLRHPVLKKLWRARHAEGRLLSWQTEAVLNDWRIDPAAAAQADRQDDEPQRLEQGPLIVCLDTSGSMRGAPEKIAKAVVIAALRSAHQAGRACRLIAFGGPGELIQQDLHRGAEGLRTLLELMAQSFDGGTDIQTPIEQAIEAVHTAAWRSADLLIVSDGEFGCVPHTLERLDEARASLGLRVQGVLVGDRETMGLLEVCDHIHWEREWRRFAMGEYGVDTRTFSPVHSMSLTALYFPNALSPRAARHRGGSGAPDARPQLPEGGSHGRG